MSYRAFLPAVLLVLAPLRLAGQTPETTREWLALFDRLGMAAGVSRAIVPCDLSNPVGEALLDQLLRPSWKERRGVELAVELGQVSWARCSDKRIDRWLQEMLYQFLDREDIGNAATVMAAIRTRGAPLELQPWSALARDARRPTDVRTEAMYCEMERKKPADPVAWVLDVMEDRSVPDEFIRAQGLRLARYNADDLIRRLDAERLVTLPRSEALIDGLGALARGRFGGASAETVVAAQRLLLAAADLAPDRRPEFTRWLVQGGQGR